MLRYARVSVEDFLNFHHTPAERGSNRSHKSPIPRRRRKDAILAFIRDRNRCPCRSLESRGRRKMESLPSKKVAANCAEEAITHADSQNCGCFNASETWKFTIRSNPKSNSLPTEKAQQLCVYLCPPFRFDPLNCCHIVHMVVDLDPHCT